MFMCKVVCLDLLVNMGLKQSMYDELTLREVKAGS